LRHVRIDAEHDPAIPTLGDKTQRCIASHLQLQEPSQIEDREHLLAVSYERVHGWRAARDRHGIGPGPDAPDFFRTGSQGLAAD